MRDLGEEFRREVYPATVDAVAEAAAPRLRLSRWLSLAPIPIAAAAAVALFFVVPLGAPRDGGRLLGDDLAIRVFTQNADGARDLTDGQGVPAGSELHFFVHPCEPCKLWLLSVDAGGKVSRLYPAQGEVGLEVSSDVTLPAGVALGGGAGPERIFAVCSVKPLLFADIERAAQAAAGGGGEEAVRRARQLPGLPDGVDQVTLLLEKR
jgi:hypothetical protein